MDNKKNYMCGICGTAYETIADRAKCESACIERQEAEAAKVAEAKKQEEFSSRIAEVKDALDKAYELDDKLFEEYGVRYIYPHYKFNDYSNPYMMILKHFVQ